MSLIFLNEVFWRRENALFVDDGAGSWPATELAVNPVPASLEVTLNRLKSVQGSHLVRLLLSHLGSLRGLLPSVMS